MRLRVKQAFEQALLAAIGLAYAEDVFDGARQIAGQITLGHIACRASLQGLDRQFFASVRRHENDRNRWILSANFLHEL